MFLESSTVHGVSYIATSRKPIKLFWTFVVVSGFFMAGALIHQSFKSWNENPITTIRTLGIDKSIHGGTDANYRPKKIKEKEQR